MIRRRPTPLNLKAAIAGETHEYTDMYPGMARTAREEGFDEIADWFETLAKAEKSHAGRFTKAHNTYLENALELGVPAAAALVLSVALLARQCLRALRRRRGVFVYGWMACCGTVLVGCHSTVDFSLQIPAVAVLYAAILGTGCSQSWSSSIDTSSRTREQAVETC